MFTIDQVNAMNDEEIAALNRKLVRRLLINRVLVPLATTVALTVAFNRYDNRSSK